jgi:hypothetical protein
MIVLTDSNRNSQRMQKLVDEHLIRCGVFTQSQCIFSECINFAKEKPNELHVNQVIKVNRTDHKTN